MLLSARGTVGLKLKLIMWKLHHSVIVFVNNKQVNLANAKGKLVTAVRV